MLKLCQVLGFTQRGVPDEPELVRVTLRLGEASAPEPKP
jgi:hypothetical protein